MSDWISVDDRLPKTTERVIIHRNIGNDETKIELIVWFNGDELDLKITHWQPLPEPPEIDKQPLDKVKDTALRFG